MNGIKAIIFVGDRDFGRCSLACRLSTALWPVVDKPVLQRLMENLAGQGITSFVICSRIKSDELTNALSPAPDWDVAYINDALPRGTAGCILDASGQGGNAELLLALNASIITLPDISKIITFHRQNDSDLTAALEPPDLENSQPEPAGIYLCSESILQYIPKKGYCDMKESLIGQLIRADRKILSYKLSASVHGFRTWRQYLVEIAHLMESDDFNQIVPDGFSQACQNVWIAPDAQVHPTAQISGPVIICNGAEIEEDVMIFGPAVIGPGAKIHKSSLVDTSVLWDSVSIGPYSSAKNSLFESGACLGFSQTANAKLFEAKKSFLSEAAGTIADIIRKVELKFLSPEKIAYPPDYDVGTGRLANVFKLWIPMLLVAAAFIWSYWNPTLLDLWNIWLRNDEYSAGLLVPAIVIYVLWQHRHSLFEKPPTPSLWWGIAALVLSQGFRLFGLFLMFQSAERISLVLTIISLVLFIFGWPMIRKLWPVLLFLFLMLPLPARVQSAITQPLQAWATSSAVFMLETLGYEVTMEGNIINLGGTMVAVAEACNGLRMLTAFVIISGMIALLVHKAWWEKLVIVLSSIPIALLCNTIRLTVTAIAFTVVSAEKWEKAFHDFGGFAMMPLAVAAIVLELWIMSNLIVKPQLQPNKIIITQSSLTEKPNG